MDLVDLVTRVTEGHDLTEGEAETAFHEIMSGNASPVQIAALLVALRTKGHASSEVAGGVRAMRRAMISVRAPDDTTVIDTCGTGGGTVTTFNISTAAAIVAAGSGIHVAKHGNRSFTSRSGSADVLEALGVVIQLSADGMARVLERAGIVFMFAQLLHPAMRHAGPVRKELRMSTLFNLLGPLTNPAGARRQVVGVADPDLLPLIVGALQALGHERALVVHGVSGVDEISPSGVTHVAELSDGRVREYQVQPEDFGATPAPLEEIAGGSPEENARVIEAVLSGEEKGGARTAVLLNAAAALYVGGKSDSLVAAFARGAEVVDSGAGLASLDALRRESAAAASSDASSEAPR